MLKSSRTQKDIRQNSDKHLHQIHKAKICWVFNIVYFKYLTNFLTGFRKLFSKMFPDSDIAKLFPTKVGNNLTR